MVEFIRRAELDFLLYDLFDLESVFEHDRFAHLDRETIDTVIDTALRVAADTFANHADRLDREEPTFDGDVVHLIDEVREAIEAFADAGFIAAGFDQEHGGMQLPSTVSQAYLAIFDAANVSTASYPLLTIAAANLLSTFGDEEQCARYLEPMLSGRFMGTMCLSEPQAGSSLSDLRTTAYPREDGSYAIVGNKMWISGSGHEMAQNIVHLVLARIEGAPAGTRGISLFVVPRYLVEDDGSIGARNDVRVAGINHKMGYRGTTNCALNFGEDGGAAAWLVGEPHRGLKYMFQMMNEARIGVGLAATMSAHTAYLYALDYAKERRQGRHPDDRDPTSSPVPIVEHADVRRMLLKQKAYIEGAWALCLQCARLVDDIETASDEATREDAQHLLDILTPIAKAWPSAFCLQANELAIQVLGGYGYSREYPVERHYRDNRLNAIHEGTNGIQALDLLGRKVTRDGGNAFRLLLGRIGEEIERCADVDELREYSRALGEASARVGETTMALGQTAMQGEIRLFLANASDYLEMLGHLVVAWLWLRQARVCLEADSMTDLHRGKLAACRFFFRRELPRVDRLADLLASHEDTPLRTDPAWL